MSEGNNQADPTRLSIEQAGKLLSAAYRERIEVAKIEEDIDSAVENPDRKERASAIIDIIKMEVRSILFSL